MDIRRWKMGGGRVGAGDQRGEWYDDLQKQLHVRKQFTRLIALGAPCERRYLAVGPQSRREPEAGVSCRCAMGG